MLNGHWTEPASRFPLDDEDYSRYHLSLKQRGSRSTTKLEEWVIYQLASCLSLLREPGEHLSSKG